MKKFTLLFIFLTITSLSAQNNENPAKFYAGFGGTGANGSQGYVCLKGNAYGGTVTENNIYLGVSTSLNSSLGKQYSDSDFKFASSAAIMHGYKKADGPSWMNLLGDQCFITGIDVLSVKAADLSDKFWGYSVSPSILHTGSFSNGNNNIYYTIRLAPFDYSATEFKNFNPDYPNSVTEASFGMCVDINAHIGIVFENNGNEVEITGKCRYYSKEYDETGKMTYVVTGLLVDYHIYDTNFGLFGDVGSKTFKTENLITENSDKATNPYANVGVVLFIDPGSKH